MELANEKQQNWSHEEPDPKSCYMQKFKLYETRSKFYMIGKAKNRTYWRVLKIDRLEPSELIITEDSAIYSDIECHDLLKRINEGNKSTGGLKFVTICYGIIGFAKFLEPYYMLLITRRRKIGAICGHTIYAITKSEMIPVPHSTVRSKMAYSKDENRYKKLLCTVDLTKDFFFSYSYHIMLSLQRNFSDSSRSGQSLYETMSVWNEFLTRGIRNSVNNTFWTVALVYGFFKQAKLSISGRDFNLTIIARRSRHYAGTRYLKRGVNEKGRVANDVETEQIVFEDAHEGRPIQISSVVQNRGSIPLFWAQETSLLNIKPDIILSKKDHSYEATKLHFENLVRRYGNPIIILNLIKKREKKARETILSSEFSNAIKSINKDLEGESRLWYLHWDLQGHSRRKAIDVLTQLQKVATCALKLTGIFYCQVTPNLKPKGLLDFPYSWNDNAGDHTVENHCYKDEKNDDGETKASNGCDSSDAGGDYQVKPPMLQAGVLRTNCIDCLDRTNVAQYACGLAALGRQLNALGFIDSTCIDLGNPLAMELMGIYESMGDTLAFQYGGSAAHNKIFSERRGQWKAATQSQEFIRSLQRYYNNTYMDRDKQKAINLFLGHFQPQQGKPALWELDSDQHYKVGKSLNIADENMRSTFKRSLSDGNIQSESDSTIENLKVRFSKLLSKKAEGIECLFESTPDISTCGCDACHCRGIYRELFEHQCFEGDHICYDELSDACNCSNFLDMDWLSSSGNSFEEELRERSTTMSSENIVNELKTETSTSASEAGCMNGTAYSGQELTKDAEYPESFACWKK
ncbi:Phosphoinositide phosphatase [Quillaja saponaria]|uniref:Phosphoinositide phosphatase n=1 Tax=Quillaja saponaria TaxID=32244 RepID=A0AAD7PE44_QUISA|nr:Phosphoinositide phosphatase [Quillaja saponaria]